MGIGNSRMPAAQLFTELGLGKEQAASIIARLDEILEAAEEAAGFQLR